MKKNILINTLIYASFSYASFAMDSDKSSGSFEKIPQKKPLVQENITKTNALQATLQDTSTQRDTLHQNLKNMQQEHNHLSTLLPGLQQELHHLGIQKTCLENAISVNNFFLPTSQKIAKENELVQVNHRINEIHQTQNRYNVLNQDIQNIQSELTHKTQTIEKLQGEIQQLSISPHQLQSKNLSEIKKEQPTKIKNVSPKKKEPITQNISNITQTVNQIKEKMHEAINQRLHLQNQLHGLENNLATIPQLQQELHHLGIQKTCLENAISVNNFFLPTSQKIAKENELVQVNHRINEIHSTIHQHNSNEQKEIENIKSQIHERTNNLTQLQTTFETSMAEYITQSIKQPLESQGIPFALHNTPMGIDTITLGFANTNYEQIGTLLPVVFFQTYEQNITLQVAARVKEIFHAPFSTECDKYYVVLQKTNNEKYQQMITPHALLFPDTPVEPGKECSKSANVHVEIYNAQGQALYQGSCINDFHNEKNNLRMRFSPDHRPSVDFFPETILYSIVHHNGHKIATLHYNMTDQQTEAQHSAKISTYAELIKFLENAKIPPFITYTLLDTYSKK